MAFSMDASFVCMLIFLLLCGLILSYLFVYYFHARPVFFNNSDLLSGRVAVITGGSKGIGYEVALDLAKRKARVIIASRNAEAGKIAVQSIKDESGNQDVIYKQLDLANFSSVHQVALDLIQTEKHIHILINNAAISYCEEGQRTKDGYHDPVFTVNYLGHFLLTYLLLDVLKRSAPSRIINVSSATHTYSPYQINLSVHEADQGDVVYPYLTGYEASKLALVLHVKELARRLSGSGVTANACHPGPVCTNLWMSMEMFWPHWYAVLARAIMRPLFMTASAAAQTVIYCAASSELEGLTGQYYTHCKKGKESRHAKDSAVCNRLWLISMLLTGCKHDGAISPVPTFDYHKEHEDLQCLAKGHIKFFEQPKYDDINRS